MLLFREKIPADWLPKILSDLPAVLVDHAHLERKAATTALNLEKYRDLYLRGRASYLFSPVAARANGARTSAGFGVWMETVLKFPDRSGVIEWKRRVRRGPLPTTSGCAGSMAR